MKIEELGKNLPSLFGALLVSILFIQSGLDKILDWNGNLEFLTKHFSKTFMSGMTPMLLGTITLMETATGLFSAAGIIYFLVKRSTVVIFYASVLGVASITALFFGLRIAKDYAGAAILIPYFILMIILMYLTNPYQNSGSDKSLFIM